MNLADRQRLFLEAAQNHFGTSAAVRPNKLFGVSNSAKIVEGGIQLGVVNLDSAKADADAFVFGCILRFPPEDEVYFAVLVKKDRSSLLSRLSNMKLLGATSKTAQGHDAVDSDQAGNTENIEPEKGEDEAGYAAKNNNVAIYIAEDGRLWLRNKGFWSSLLFDRSSVDPSVELDQIAVAIYPPTASARRSLLAREFVGWLGSLIGQEKIHEIPVWTDEGTLGPEMRRLPATLNVDDIALGVGKLGGYYPNGEVRRLHAALNFLSHKHFVILSGLSGTGKTQLALKYARAVHGLATADAPDPLIFECPVRPEWTDPTGLTGYYDVLTNRYVVPTFLEAVLVATAHPDAPVFVILDEMNLARVEYYLSDILSSMESGGALQLHSNVVPLEGTTGASIRAELPLPPNLFIIGTINVDETTNPISDKVLDRASVLDMSAVDVPGFLASLETRHPDLKGSRAATEGTLTTVHALLQQHGLGFGYRLVEEFVRYHAFDASHLKTAHNEVLDQLLVQKVLVKLRGAERQRKLLTNLDSTCASFPMAQAFIRKLLNDLDEFGSFQAMR